ncbi:MAG: lytic transglycosylase domain-containing protein [Planctomycetota bacterium]|nr:lytic transglycosylase domain-containing protein [Planctomycetota bacterium]
MEPTPDAADQMRLLGDLEPDEIRDVRGKRLITYGALALLILLSLVLLAHSRTRLSEDLRALVRDAADRHGLDVRLVEAVVRAESRGVPDAVSHAEAYGLMQLQVPTASELAERAVTVQELFDPRLNLDLGCKYLHRLLSLYRGDVKFALMAYNAGPGHVRKWRRKSEDPDEILEKYAFAETRRYVAKVMGYLAED